MNSRYPQYSQETNDLLDFARAVRRFAAKYPDDVNAPSILQHVDRFMANCGWDLLELVLDSEERINGATTKREPEIEMVRQVTIEHGLAFAQSWYDGEGDIVDACTHTEIMTWPGGSEDQKEAHARFLDIEDEICANVFGLVKRQIAEAFVRAANEVLDRERSHGDDTR